MSAPRIGPAPLPQYSEPNQAPAPADISSAGDTDVVAWNDKDGPSFSDLLDILNPLQHIPVVSTLYRHLTGDEEGAMDDIIGGTLYGGPIGLGVAIANLMVEDSTGQGIGDHVYTALFDDSDVNSSVAETETEDATSVASGDDAPPPPVAAVAPQAVSSQPLQDNSVKNGPARSGDFLVFGSAAATAATATPSFKPVTVGSNSATPLAPAATDKQSMIARQVPASPVSGSSNSVQQGDFLIFGGSVSAATSSQPAAMPTSTGAGALAADPSKTTPFRRTSAVPPSTLPKPTTGPGALPGGQSQALKPAQTTAPSNDWFASTFSQNMDKYETLHGNSGTAPTSLN